MRPRVADRLNAHALHCSAQAPQLKTGVSDIAKTIKCSISDLWFIVQARIFQQRWVAILATRSSILATFSDFLATFSDFLATLGVVLATGADFAPSF